MKSLGLAQIFCPYEAENRTQGLCGGFSAEVQAKRCVKMAWLSLAVIPE